MLHLRSIFHLARCLSLLLLWAGVTNSALAVTDILRVDLSVDNTTLSIRDWQEAKLRLRYNCSSTTTNASNATISITLPAEMEAVSLTGSIHTTATNYNTSLRLATFTFVNPLPAGSSGDVFISVRFLQTTPENTKVKVQALFASLNSLPKLSQQVQITGINAPATTTYTFVKGMKITKTVSDSNLDANYGYSLWYIYHGNTGATGQDVNNYTVEDIFPPGLMLDSLTNEGFPSTNANVTVYYKTNKNSTYRQWGSGPLYKTGDGQNWFYPGSLGMIAGEYVTALKWSYGKLPGGGTFHHDAMSRPIAFYTRVVNPANPAFAAGKTFSNCATVTGTAETSRTSCASVTMTTPAPNFGFWHYVSNPGSAPYLAGSKIQYTVAFGINAQSSTAVTNPSLGVLLPKELSYSGNPVVWGEAFTDASSPAPKFTQTLNWKGTGRTLVRWSWSASTGNPFTIPYQRNWRYVYINFDATIAAATTDGWYRSTAYGNWSPNGKGGSWFEQDVEDWDSNGNTAEMRARHDLDLQIVAPAPHFSMSHRIENDLSPYEMNETLEYRTRLTVDSDSAAPMVNPVIGVLLPKEIEYLGNPVFSGDGYLPGTHPAPKFQRIDNFGSPGATLIRWGWTTAGGNGLTIPADGTSKYINVVFSARIKNFTPNGSYKTWGYANYQPNGKGYTWIEPDVGDFDGNGNTTEYRALNDEDTVVLTAGGSAGFNSEMLVKGELDTNWTAFPAKGLTTPGGKADYKVTLTNPSGVIMRNLVLIDILPTVGDKGVIDLSARDSQWSPYLAAPVAASGATVSYSLSSNPCRDELTPGIPVGCEPANWTVTPPADITKVKSIKIDFGATKIYPGDNLVIQWPMRAPVNAPSAGEVAWNSFGYIATRDDDGSSLLASEPIKTGISIKPSEPPFYGDYVWNDANKNGLQDADEDGVNGVRVEFYRDNGDQLNNPANDTLIGFTTTAFDGTRDGAYLFANMGAGNYYAIVIPPPDWGISPQDQGSDDVDSDGAAIIYQGGRAALMPLTTLDALEEDRTWDQGIYDRSGQPSVWAMVTMDNGQSLLGGRFLTSHGLPRRNIVRVNADGGVDRTFTPGSGFNGEVRSLALRSDGQIVAGGSFTSYNGKAANGVALISANGTSSIPLPTPDAANVRWVGVANEGMYIGGAFNSVGGNPRRNLARLTTAGTLDTGFDSSNGANGIINTGAVQADGKIIIAGNFTSYNGSSCPRIARINTNGSIDSSFNPSSGANGEVFSLKMLEDGRIILTGSFTAFNNQPCNGTMRLMPDGSQDPTIAPSALTVDSIQSAH